MRRPARSSTVVMFAACVWSCSTHPGGSGGGSSVDTSQGGRPATGADAGPVAQVRLANYLRPTFLQLDVCFRASDGTWYGPTLLGARDRADGIVDSVRHGKVGPYFAIPPGVYTARLVEEGNADCLTQIQGLPDVPIASSFDASSTTTLWATGSAISGGQAFQLRATADRSPASGKLLIRVFQLDEDYGAVDVWGQDEHDPPAELYDNLAEGDLSAAYHEFDSSKGQPFYKDFDVRPHGTSAPFLTRTFNTLSDGSWTITTHYALGVGTPPVDFSMCQDGVLGPRLCYPCGLPDCTNH